MEDGIQTAMVAIKKNQQLEKVKNILADGLMGEFNSTIVDGREITMGIVEIDPEMAKKLLVYNVANRPISKPHLSYLTKEMSGNRWDFNGQTIIFSASGSLSDGQHRLTTLIATNTTILSAVVLGVAPKSFENMDNNRSRVASDVMAIGGVSNSKLANAVAQHIYSFRNGRFSVNKTGKRNLSNTEVLDYYNQLGDASVQESIRLGMTLYTKSERLITPKVLATFHYMFKQTDPTLATEFISDLALGENFTEGKPVKALYSKFFKAKVDDTFRFTGMDVDLHMVYAWNKARLGKSMKRFSIDENFEPKIL